jgi:hypothetical protein
MRRRAECFRRRLPTSLIFEYTSHLFNLLPAIFHVFDFNRCCHSVNRSGGTQATLCGFYQPHGMAEAKANSKKNSAILRILREIIISYPEFMLSTIFV